MLSVRFITTYDNLRFNTHGLTGFIPAAVLPSPPPQDQPGLPPHRERLIDHASALHQLIERNECSSLPTSPKVAFVIYMNAANLT
jgi:hypothetical protein